MADVNVYIPNPTLQVGQYFGVRYRSILTPTWTDISPKTNAPFIIPILSDGHYILEYWLNNGDEDCTSNTINFEVLTPPITPPPPTDIGVGVMEVEGQYIMNVDYTPPSPSDVCGYVVTVEYNNTIETYTYQTLPSEGLQYNVPFAEEYTVKIYVDLCGGVLILCDEETYEYEVPTCTPADISDEGLSLVLGVWQIALEIIQPIPNNFDWNITYQQTDIVYSGTPDSGIIVMNNATTPTDIIWEVTPNLSVVNGQINYDVNINNGCGGYILLKVSALIS